MKLTRSATMPKINTAKKMRVKNSALSGFKKNTLNYKELKFNFKQYSLKFMNNF